DLPAAVSFSEDAGRGDISGEESVEELEGDELLNNLEMQTKSAYVRLMQLKSRQQWARAESELRRVHTGGALRTLRKRRLEGQSREMTEAVIRNSLEAERFRAFFKHEEAQALEGPALTANEHARLAGTNARQGSDADFARMQI
ncbi:hypothetical protein BD310DRAFT_788657, partial [Dichomitus squalens]